MHRAFICVAAMTLLACGGGDGNPSGDDAGAEQDASAALDASRLPDATPVEDATPLEAASDAPDASEIKCGVLDSGQELAQGQSVDACNDEGFGKMSLAMQTDGNLVLYQDDVCQQPTWASSTNGKGGFKAVMQTDGDFVLFDASSNVLWHSNTAGNAGATLAIQGDGNLVVYTTANKPIWSTGTWHQKPTNKLWIAQDSGAANSAIQNYWRVVLEMSLNFGRMEAAWTYGRALAFGGYKVLGSPCSVLNSTSASVSQDSAVLQCIENQTNWSIASGDVILYYPQGFGCEDGRNHWNIPVTHNGSHDVEAAFAFTGSGSQCQEALGSHEVYEASSQPSSGDCCNGQDGCAATPSPYGWYSFSKCGATYWAQAVAPNPAGEYSASACTKLSF